MQNQCTVPFKVYFQSRISRFRLNNPTYTQFVQFLQNSYNIGHYPKSRLQYQDNEGDNIDITSQFEWKEMFEGLKNEKTIKIYVKDGDGNYYEDGPEPVLAHAKPVENKHVPAEILLPQIPIQTNADPTPVVVEYAPVTPDPVSVLPVELPSVPTPVVPLGSPQPAKWEQELIMLHDIGFFNDELLIDYLENQCQGSVERTVKLILCLQSNDINV